jgi:hypothetical protein
MEGKIKIRTMKDDLADTENEELSEIELKARQDKNKISVAQTKITGSGAIPGAPLNKLKDEEISELRSLIKKISKTTDEEIPEKKQIEEQASEKNIAAEITSGEIASKQQEQYDLKDDKEKGVDDKTKELKNLIDKVSKTVEKEKDQATKEFDIKTPAIEKDGEIKKEENNKQSFWGNISEKLKNNKSPESQKINELRKKDKQITESVKDIKNASEEIAKKEYSDSGVLTKKESPEIKEEENEKEINKSFYGNDYQSPENRLIFGKQKLYSSVSKRIKLKEKSDDIENLKTVDGTKEKQNIISEDEKYKKLKNRVIKKYNIKLFLLPWKKIILISIVLIVLTGAAFYVFVKKLTPPPIEPPVIIAGTEIEDFAKIRSEVEFTKNDIAKMGFKENNINKKFRLSMGAEELRVVIKHNGNMILPRDAMESIKINTDDFPKEFWETVTKSYNIFALKTGKDSFKFAIAVESNDIVSLLKTMRTWEEESVDKKKMFNVFEPIFTDSKIEENFGQSFESANYKQAYVRYLNLPDQNTSFDYFASNDTLIITASKENTFRMIDILSNDNYYDYGD